MSRDTYPHWMFDDSPIEDPAIFKTKSGEEIGGGERAVRFIRAVRHPITGQPFQLDRPYERLIRRIFGPRHPDGTRIVKEVPALIPRGNRKTTLGAAIALLMCAGPERRKFGQTILAAYNREQSAIAFDEVKGFVSKDADVIVNPKIADACQVRDYANEIEHLKSGSIIRAIASDHATQNGKTPYFVLFDELHQWTNAKLYNTLRTGLSKTGGTLGLVISQSGRGQETLAFETYEFARKVAAGEIENPTILPVLFETDPDADIFDEAVWHRANPGLRYGYPDLASFRTEAQMARERPALRDSFKNDKLNIWLDQSQSPFVEMAVYDHGKAPIDFDRLKAQPAYVAIDMSVTTDLTAVVTAWRDPDDDEHFIVSPKFFCPANELRKRGDRDGVPYTRWAEEGFITPTPGDVIDYRAIVEHVRSLYDEFNVAEVVYDRAYAMPVVLGLQDHGIEALAMPLDPKSQAAGVAVMERAIGARKFRHGGHPVLRWNVANVSIYTGPSGLRTMHKGKSTDRIDGAFAAWMAVARAAANQTTHNPLADPDCDPASWFAA